VIEGFRDGPFVGVITGLLHRIGAEDEKTGLRAED